MDSTSKQRDSIIPIYSKNMDCSSESQVSYNEQFMVSTVNKQRVHPTIRRWQIVCKMMGFYEAVGDYMTGWWFWALPEIYG